MGVVFALMSKSHICAPLCEPRFTQGLSGCFTYPFEPHPFSLQKITWNETSKIVIYRSKRHHNIKRNFQIFKAADFIAAAIDHLPPKESATWYREVIKTNGANLHGADD